jgi:hypothetical protein
VRLAGERADYADATPGAFNIFSAVRLVDTAFRPFEEQSPTRVFLFQNTRQGAPIDERATATFDAVSRMREAQP